MQIVWLKYINTRALQTFYLHERKILASNKHAWGILILSIGDRALSREKAENKVLIAYCFSLFNRRKHEKGVENQTKTFEWGGFNWFFPFCAVFMCLSSYQRDQRFSILRYIWCKWIFWNQNYRLYIHWLNCICIISILELFNLKPYFNYCPWWATSLQPAAIWLADLLSADRTSDWFIEFNSVFTRQINECKTASDMDRGWII